MAKIIKKVKLNAPQSKSVDTDSTKGKQSDPFTKSEMETLKAEENWNGGYVEGIGYVVPMAMSSFDDSNSNGSEASGITLEGKYEDLSSYTQNLLRNLTDYSGVIYITSTARTPEQQASAMLANIKRTGKETQKKIYKKAGQQVIDVYDAQKTDEENLAAMTAKIYEVGPENVSHHCCNPSTLNVFDVSKSRLSNVTKFKQAVATIASKTPLDENGCIHVEITQR